MTQRRVWLGSTGPFLYDDTVYYIDPDYGQSPYTQVGINTDGQLLVGGTPTDPYHVARKIDLDNIASNFGTMAYQDANAVAITGGTAQFTRIALGGYALDANYSLTGPGNYNFADRLLEVSGSARRIGIGLAGPPGYLLHVGGDAEIDRLGIGTGPPASVGCLTVNQDLIVSGRTGL